MNLLSIIEGVYSLVVRVQNKYKQKGITPQLQACMVCLLQCWADVKHTHALPSKEPASLLLLDVKDGDHVSLFQQEVSSPGMEDGLTGGSIHLLGDLILQVLDDNLREERVELRRRVHR